MRFKLTLVLLLLNATILLALFYLERSRLSEAKFDEASSLVLPSRMIDQAQTLEISGPALDQPWQLERAGKEWRLTSPIEWTANPFAVSRILDQLRALEWETRFSRDDLEDTGRSLADYGLDPAKATVTLSTGEESLSLHVGQPTEIGNRLYVLSPDSEAVYVVSRGLLDAVTMDLKKLRSNNIFALRPLAINAIDMQVNNENTVRVRLVRRGETWRFEAPIQAAADRDATERVLEKLLSAEVARFVSADRLPEIQANTLLRLKLEAPDARRTLLVGPTEGENLRLAAFEDTSTPFLIPAPIIEPFLKAQEALRERRILDFAAMALSEFEISAGDQSALLQRLETGDWQVVQRLETGGLRTWPVDTTPFAAVLQELKGLEAQSFVSDAPSTSDLNSFGLNNPSRRVRLKTTEQELVVLFGDLTPDGESVYVKVESKPFVYAVDRSLLSELSPRPLHYRRRALEVLPPTAQLQRIELVDEESGEVLLERVVNGKLPDVPDGTIYTGPSNDEEAIGLLGRWLRGLSVARYLRDYFEAPFMLDEDTSIPWRYRLVATFELPAASGSSLRELSFRFSSRQGGATQFGGSREHGVIFLLPQTLIDALHELTFQKDQPSRETPPSIPEAEQVEEPSPQPPLGEADAEATEPSPATTAPAE